MTILKQQLITGTWSLVCGVLVSQNWEDGGSSRDGKAGRNDDYSILIEGTLTHVHGGCKRLMSVGLNERLKSCSS